MGRRGPKPKSKQEKLLAGNPGKRPLAPEVKPELGRPPRPEWLLPLAVEKWEELLPLLERMKVLAIIDGTALAQYCQCYARWREAEEFLTAHGTVCVLRSDKGEVKNESIAPEFLIAVKLLEKMNMLGTQFGLSPVARSRINLPGDDEDQGNDKSKFFGGLK